ncbi:undecaprenyl-phosphate galactose phosphotransferase WbaP [Insolitispirillum peregrinum]
MAGIMNNEYAPGEVQQSVELDQNNLRHRVLSFNRTTFILADMLVILAVNFGLRALISEAQVVWYKTVDGVIVTQYSGLDPFLFLAIGGVIYFQSIGIYSLRRPLWDQMRPVAQTCSLLFFLDAVFLYMGAQPYSLLIAAVSWLSLTVALGLVRVATRVLLKKMGKWYIPTVIIGTGQNALQTAEAVIAEPSMGYQICYFVTCPDQGEQSSEEDRTHMHLRSGDIPIIPLTPDLLSSLHKRHGPHIIIALEAEQAKMSADLMLSLAVRPTAINIVPPVHGIPLYGLEVNHLLARELLLLQVRNNLARQAPRLMKRVIDLVGAASLLLLLSPLLLILSLLVLRTGRPIIYGHQRIGQNGKPFKCLKFRSMVTNSAEVLKEILATDPEARAEWERDFKLKNDPRITKIGHFLRRSSMDELPQLWNVLRGEMSLVGPRPIVEKELEYYGDNKEYYFLVKPGITGLWQVSGRNDVDYDHRVFLDSWYVRNWSLWYDISILLRTFSVVFGKKGAY